MLFHRLFAALVFAALVLFGCAAKQATPVVRLEVSAQGTYLVDGAPVEQSALATSLSSKRRPGEELFVHIVPLPGAKYEAVSGAVEAAQKAEAKIGMVGNVRF
jgi:biopolymer transport protein ExbD